MDNKRSNPDTDKKITENKKRRSVITFEKKLDIVTRYENKERSCDIARALNLSQSTIRTILIQSEKIKERSKRLASLNGTRFLRPRSSTMETMEKQLADWMKYENERNNPVSFVSIKEKAKELYEKIRVEINDVDAKPFVASHGWLDRFKKRMKLFKLEPQEENSSMHNNEAQDLNVLNEYQKIFKQVIEKGTYSPKQVFSLHEFGLYWRRLPSRDKNSSILEKDRVTVALCANAFGDCKLKPVVIYRHSRDPIALRGYSKDHLPAVLRYSSKGEMTPKIFNDYFCNRLTNELKDYCLKENIPFKILLVLERVPHHPDYLEDFSKDIKELFLPPMTKNWLHPMQFDVQNQFQLNYLHSILSKTINDMYADGANSIDHYNSKLTIKDAIDYIGYSWMEVDRASLKDVWYRLWPDFAGEYKSFALSTKVTEIKDKIISLAKDIDLESSTIDVMNYMDSSTEELTAEELEYLKEDHNGEDSDEEDYEIRTLAAQDIFEAFQYIRTAINIFDENDYNRERSFEVIRHLEAATECYKQMYKEKRRNELQAEFSEVEIKVESDVDGELDFTAPEFLIESGTPDEETV